MPMQPFMRMGDLRHKKPPPDEEEEDVTNEFRAAAQKKLRANAQQNRLRKRRKDDPDYLISNHAELAEEIGTSKTMLNRIIGPVRETTAIKLVARSVFVKSIREALALADVTQISVQAVRAEVLRIINDLPDDLYKVFAAEVARLDKRR